MPLKTSFTIVTNPNDIRDPVTKFGGQPVWQGAPQWPISPATGEQMRFLGQIALAEELFPNSQGAMVYLFFSDDAEPLYDEAFATVIQSSAGAQRSAVPEVSFGSEATGPTLFARDEEGEPLEQHYAVVLNSLEDEPVVPLEERYTYEDLDYSGGYQFARPAFAGNKIGGQPMYIGQLSVPPAEFTSADWLLLLQLAPTQGYYAPGFQPNFYPFAMELGEFGILTVFLSRDYTRTVCYVQQP
jgi:hypothetical protein